MASITQTVLHVHSVSRSRVKRDEKEKRDPPLTGPPPELRFGVTLRNTVKIFKKIPVSRR